jgi:nucleotide-binding universal stress UspA family protein
MSGSSLTEVSVLVGFDGSLSATASIDVGARLLPAASANILFLWEPPFAAPELRQRLVREARTLDDLIASLEHEGSADADRVAALGVVVAQAAGWTARPLVQRSYGGDGYQFARLAEDLTCSVVLVGSRGLSGSNALLGSVSDVIVHLSPVPVLVVPHPLTSIERTAASEGPVLVGIDGSPGSTEALQRATDLFAGRTIVQAAVEPRTGDDASVEAGGESAVVQLDRHGHGAGGVAEALSEHAAQQGAGVIVVGSRGRSAGRELLLGSVAKALLHRAQRPVLIVPSGGRLS